MVLLRNQDVVRLIIRIIEIAVALIAAVLFELFAHVWS
jgi:hypothetical protein